MAQMYVWVAETKKGRKLKGETEAASEQIARAQLKKTKPERIEDKA